MSVGRRAFLKLLGFVSGILAISQFAPVVRFLSGETGRGRYPRQRIANVNDLKPGERIIFTYPKTGDPEKDNDPFRRFLLIKLPDGELKAFSMVCIHLWCLADYKGERNTIECPCHGSVYRVEDGLAIRGPAAFQQNKHLPECVLEVDEKGDVYVVDVIGVIGYGKEGDPRWKRALKKLVSSVVR